MTNQSARLSANESSEINDVIEHCSYVALLLEYESFPKRFFEPWTVEKKPLVAKSEWPEAAAIRWRPEARIYR